MVSLSVTLCRCLQKQERFEAFVNVVRETDGEVVTFFGTFGFGGGGGHKRCVGERGEREQLSVGLSKKMFKNLSNHPNP